jgi:hypothetical protein
VPDCAERLVQQLIRADGKERSSSPPLNSGRVCQAWHRTSEVQVLVPGMRGAEGEEQGQGVHREVGSGGSPIHTRGATHRNRRCRVGHPGRAGTCPRSPPAAGGALDTSGVYARNVLGLPLGDLLVVQENRTERGEIGAERPAAGSRG